MKRIVVVLGMTALMSAVAALVAGTALAQAQTERFQITEPLEFVAEATDCTGEDILFEGVLHTNIVVTTNGNVRHVVSRNNAIDLTGTGLETGDEYRLTLGGSLTENQIKGDRYVYAEEGHSVLISEGDSSNQRTHYRSIVVYDFTHDQPSVSIDAFSLDCTPGDTTTS
jgi:hypothetical protein